MDSLSQLQPRKLIANRKRKDRNEKVKVRKLKKPKISLDPLVEDEKALATEVKVGLP